MLKCLFRKKDVTWESKIDDRKYMFAEMARIYAIAKQSKPSLKIRLPKWLHYDFLRFGLANQDDLIDANDPKYKSIYEAKNNNFPFGNQN